MSGRQTAADQLVERLIDWGIDTVFGLPGDGINGVMESLRTRADRILFHPRPPRGDRRARRLCLWQVHRPSLGLPGHRGARRRAPDERSL
jgi:hypothetical protein